MTTDASAEATFATLGLADPVQQALADTGYEVPTPIQSRTIPPLLAGQDVLGQAQTGTGKTAAFALPLLSRIRLEARLPQVLVLTPTRELAIQVAEAFQRYASRLKGLHVLPIYGGQDYAVQLKMLKRGVQVVVGTPGRVMDHLRRGTLDLSGLSTLVLDEADEMLRMGFIDDVEWILGHTPPQRQLALFSATLPAEVKRIAQRHLRDPVEIRVKESTATAALVRQRVWIVSGTHKLDALTRILEVEPFDGMIVFVRTRTATTELAERLSARGFDAAAMHGDVPQRERERLIAGLRSGRLDILVATDVAARGLDVERVSHVINFDIPYDAEAYVHRIGRTGRAGRSGDAILFVAPRERHMLRSIERATRQPIEVMDLPSHETINNVRVTRFFEGLTTILAEEDLTELVALMERYQLENDVEPLRLAAALAHQAKGGSLLLKKRQSATSTSPRGSGTPDARPSRDGKPEDLDQRAGQRGGARGGTRGGERPQTRRPAGDAASDRPRREPRQGKRAPDVDTELFRLEVGRSHGAEPRNIVGAIVNEAGVEPNYIGKVEMFDEHCTVELPVGMPKSVFEHLKNVWVANRRLNLSRLDVPGAGTHSGKRGGRTGRGRPDRGR